MIESQLDQIEKFDIEAETLRNLLLFLYTNTIEVSPTEAIDLLSLAK